MCPVISNVGGTGEKSPWADFQKLKLIPAIAFVQSVYWVGQMLDCVPVAARRGINLVKNPTLQLCEADILTGSEVDLCGNNELGFDSVKVSIVVSFAPYQNSCETLLAGDEGI